MADLVDKFFKADLSPEEEESLDSLLGSSVEEANRFADKAAESYGRFGLPDPGMGPGAGGRARRWIIGLALMGLAFLGWFAWRHHGLETAGSVVPKASSPASQSGPAAESVPTSRKGRSRVPPRSKAKKSIPHARAQAKGKVSRAPVSTKHPAASPAPAAERVKPAAVPDGRRKTPEALPSKGTPLPPAAPGGRAYSRLRIKVDVPLDGPVTVRVLDSAGHLVTTLYSGTLPAGTHAFTWDGRLDDGRTAPPGAYRVETRSGASVQSMEFLIESKGRK